VKLGDNSSRKERCGSTWASPTQSQKKRLLRRVESENAVAGLVRQGRVTNLETKRREGSHGVHATTGKARNDKQSEEVGLKRDKWKKGLPVREIQKKDTVSSTRKACGTGGGGGGGGGFLGSGGGGVHQRPGVESNASSKEANTAADCGTKPGGNQMQDWSSMLRGGGKKKHVQGS